MATPLGELLRQLRTDTDVQIRFHQSPAEYLHEHGWGDLDAADVQEAMLLLADAAPAAEASGWIAAGDAIDPESGDAAAALDTAIGTLGGDAASNGRFDDVDELDELDELDGLGESDPGDLDGLASGDGVDALPDVIPATATPAIPATESTPATDPSAPSDADELLDDLADHDLGDEFDPVASESSPEDTALTDEAGDAIDPTIDPNPDPDWDVPS